MGRTGAGKSFLCNCICRFKEKIFKDSNSKLNTTEYTKKAVFTLPNNQKAIIIDTPGLNDNRPDHDNYKTLFNLIEIIQEITGGKLIVLFCEKDGDRLSKEEIEFFENFLGD